MFLADRGVPVRRAAARAYTPLAVFLVGVSFATISIYHITLLPFDEALAASFDGAIPRGANALAYMTPCVSTVSGTVAAASGFVAKVATGNGVESFEAARRGDLAGVAKGTDVSLEVLHPQGTATAMTVAGRKILTSMNPDVARDENGVIALVTGMASLGLLLFAWATRRRTRGWTATMVGSYSSASS